MHHKHVCYTSALLCCVLTCCLIALEWKRPDHVVLQKGNLASHAESACHQLSVNCHKGSQHQNGHNSEQLSTQSIAQFKHSTAACTAAECTSNAPLTPASSTVSRAAAASTVSSASQPPCTYLRLFQAEYCKQAETHNNCIKTGVS
jgi:hypothetical protein